MSNLNNFEKPLRDIKEFAFNRVLSNWNKFDAYLKGE
jgi:hypothetical protein